MADDAGIGGGGGQTPRVLPCSLLRRSEARGLNPLPRGGAHRAIRVMRGGSWSSFPEHLHAAYRNWNPPHFRNYGIGFRVVRTLDW